MGIAGEEKALRGGQAPPEGRGKDGSGDDASTSATVVLASSPFEGARLVHCAGRDACLFTCGHEDGGKEIMAATRITLDAKELRNFPPGHGRMAVEWRNPYT